MQEKIKLQDNKMTHLVSTIKKLKDFPESDLILAHSIFCFCDFGVFIFCDFAAEAGRGSAQLVEHTRNQKKYKRKNFSKWVDRQSFFNYIFL